MITLLKHEALRTRGMLGIGAGLLALLVLLGTVLSATRWPILAPLGIVFGAVALGVLAPVLQLLLTADYYRSSYSRTGYFTHALPIRGGKIYAAKVIWASIVTIAALAVSLLLAGIYWVGLATFLGADRNPFTAAAGLWDSITAVTSTGLLISGAVFILAMYLVWPVQYFFAVSRGSEMPLNRWGVGGPVLIFVILYVASQLAGMIGLFVLPFGLAMQDGSLGFVPYSLLDDLRLGGGGAEEIMPLGFLPALLLLSVYCLWRTVRSWNRKVSLV
ncbi:MAG TPA: hypothetical protein VK063_13735 [Beutenbergiaceae bacterium]|nr:hypothetical protein [Beutenbergiaceae bacterium]